MKDVRLWKRCHAALALMISCRTGIQNLTDPLPKPPRYSENSNTYMVQIWKLYLYSVNFHWAMVAAPPNPPTEHVRIAICPSPFLFTQPPQGALSSTKPVLFDGKRGPYVKGLLPGA